MSPKTTVPPEKIALLGGSFDPVHNGHIHAAKRARERLGFDEIVLVPNYQNPLKGESHAPPEARLEMLKLATGGIEGIQISDEEIQKKSPSYTAETLRSWKKQLGKNGELWFLLGDDSDTTKWKNYKEIFELSKVAVILRDTEADWKEIDGRIITSPPVERFGIPKESGLKLAAVLAIRHLDISSTRVRNLIKKGEKFEHLVPLAVADFIKREKLYSEEVRK